jgi:HK97 family phage major capsid protein
MNTKVALTEEQIVQRADLTLSDLNSNGGLLSPEQNNTFIQNLTDQDTILRIARTVPMNNPEQRINKIGFGSNIMKPASQDRSASTSLHEGRRLTEAHRSKPTTSQVVLTTKEVMAEVNLGYEIFEDNIEREQLQNTILALISAKMAEELENLAINGDLNATSGADPWLDYMDGWLAQCSGVGSHVYDAGGSAVSANVFNEASKTLPTKYRANKSKLRFMTSMDVESDYRLAVSSRGTGLGDAILTGTQALPVFGVPMVGAAFMPGSNILMCDPRNLIMGIQRNVRLETDKDIRSREIIIVVTMRIALAIEEIDAMVKVSNLG